MGNAPRTFVAGHPVGHSRSPLIHGFWLDRHGIDGSYEAVDVAPEDFAALIADVRRGGWAGGNVTIPHKESAFRLADLIDSDAEAIGAVNTLWMEGATLAGGNTDAYGFAANLDQRLPGWRDAETALVLGAGGASRAVVHALAAAGYKRIDVVNRTPERAENLAAAFDTGVAGHAWEKAARFVPAADMIVNTTSLGMHGQPPLTLDLDAARTGAFATDIVYVPLVTPFLGAAGAAGLATCDGLGMLLHQAVPGFERWFGTRPRVDETLRNHILNDLKREHE